MDVNHARVDSVLVSNHYHLSALFLCMVEGGSSIWGRKTAADERDEELSKMQRVSRFGTRVVNEIKCMFTGEKP